MSRPSIAGPAARAELDALQDTIARYRDGRVPEAVFLEYRLRHGVYGQRQDGVHMLRSKLPLGLLSPEQLDAFADIAERYGSGVAHLTTRQDIQVHFVPLASTPDLLRVLADAEGTAREACGNVVRNVTASVDAGVAPDEAFDVTPYGMALARFLLRHPDGQSLGRKFKITLAGAFGPDNQAAIHDLGLTAVVRDGVRGFHVRVGGGLGAVPHEAPVLAEFVPTDELLPTALAVLRVFSAHGEKAKRARARLKFLVADWGIARFREAVAAERAGLADDPVWRAFDLDAWDDAPLAPPGEAEPPRSEAEGAWRATNVRRQRQAGYAAVKVRVPRGDLDPAQLRGLARLVREVGDTLRIGVDQSLLLRWVALDRLGAVYDALGALGLAEARAGGLADPVTCPGADTCKLGITSPRRAVRAMADRLERFAADPRVALLRMHLSGCPNACAQHTIADIGLFGAARTVGGRAAPHFVVMVGGRADGLGVDGTPGSGFALPLTKVPAARLGDAVERIVAAFVAESPADEAFGDWVRRTDRGALKATLNELQALPDDEASFREHGSDAPFAVRRGVGECAGEIVGLADLLMAEADGEADRAVAALEAGDAQGAQAHARAALSAAARALLATDGLTTGFDEAEAFRVRWYEAGRIFEGVGHYYLQAVQEGTVDGDRLRRLTVEAGLFVEEVHTVLGRLAAAAAK
ncbi:MAG: nitrite/sulfite reductase [Myxococcota bacterium]